VKAQCCSILCSKIPGTPVYSILGRIALLSNRGGDAWFHTSISNISGSPELFPSLHAVHVSLKDRWNSALVGCHCEQVLFELHHNMLLGRIKERY